MRQLTVAAACLCASFFLMAQESLPVEVKAHSEADNFNDLLRGMKSQLALKFEELKGVYDDEERCRSLLQDVKVLRDQIRKAEEKWHKASVEEASKGDDPYAMWDVGETTLSQLIMEYGALDFLYVIPQELSGMKISLFSAVQLPRESWSEMIELILSQNGIGAKRLNPYVKQLYILKLDPSAIEAVVAKEDELSLFSSQSRLFFVFSAPPEQLKSIQSFFERFSDPKQTIIQAVGSKIAIVSNRDTVEKLLGLYRAIWEKSQGKIVKVVNLTKVSPLEAEKVLKAAFADTAVKGRATYYPSSADELTTLVLPQGLVLVGETATVERAQKILSELELQLEDPSEKIIHWYTCKHSNPEEVAEVLSKVYDSLSHSAVEKKESAPALAQPPAPSAQAPTNPPAVEQPGPFPYTLPGAAFNPVMPATAPFVQPGLPDKEQKVGFGNFIVDNKTTSILMVVKREELPKIKALLKKLDVPKRMVQLDVLLVEKKLHDNREMGFNILQLGTNASGKKETSFSYHAGSGEQNFRDGLISFLFSRPSGSFPAADIRFNFLLAQEDVRIKANPSVLAINQTPAQVSIVEEISINNGAFPINTPTGVVVEKSFTRAQYGITINLTPTIHPPDDEDEESKGFVSLTTDLEFDSTKIISADDRPPVTRRHIENEVRVADGETIILGGLRQKIEEDTREKIPFLGDLPGVGKLFGTTRSKDISTEMFIFITPRIIRDPVEDLQRIREEEYRMRPGDIPEFLQCIDAAKEAQRKKLFDQSLKLLFDMY